MHARMRTRWHLWVIPIAAILTIVSGRILFLASCTVVNNLAIYPALTFSGYDDRYTMVETIDPSNCELYIDLPGHGPVKIESITPQMLTGDFTRQKHEGGYSDESYSNFVEEFFFRNGRLVRMYSFSSRLRFSNRKDGKYLSFPTPHARLLEVFGKPEESQRSRRNVGPQYR